MQENWFRRWVKAESEEENSEPWRGGKIANFQITRDIRPIKECIWGYEENEQEGMWFWWYFWDSEEIGTGRQHFGWAKNSLIFG